MLSGSRCDTTFTCTPAAGRPIGSRTRTMTSLSGIVLSFTGREMSPRRMPYDPGRLGMEPSEITHTVPSLLLGSRSRGTGSWNDPSGDVNDVATKSLSESRSCSSKPQT